MKNTQSRQAVELEIVVQIEADLPLLPDELKLLQSLLPELIKESLWQLEDTE